MKTPEVTVTLAVYNGAEYLREALDSILLQTGVDFELVVVDDGSTDNSNDILSQYKTSDERIRIIRTENRGQSLALNLAIQDARAPLIAQMDQDDVCVPGRLREQCGFMSSRKDVDICGTWSESFSGTKTLAKIQFPEGHDEIRAMLAFQSPLVHPSVVMRKNVFTELGIWYRSIFFNDYDLWIRLQRKVKFANISKTLVKYRVHEGQRTSRISESIVDSSFEEILKPIFSSLGLVPTSLEIKTHIAGGHFIAERSAGYLSDLTIWFGKLAAANRERQAFPEPQFSKAIAERFWFACNVAAGRSTDAWKLYWSAPMRTAVKPPALQMLKFALKCGLRI